MHGKRIYVYKCVVDDGGAPCVDDEMLTLTICKPYIRSTARLGDLILAFGSNREIPANRLVYVAEVKQRFSNGEYYRHDEFRHRKDCIYEWKADRRLERRKDAKFHNYPEARISDLGDEGHYPKANALLSIDFRYFGKEGTAEWTSLFPKLHELVKQLCQGHRVNFYPELCAELLHLKDWIWRKHPHKKILGTPLHAPDEQIDIDPENIVKVCEKRCYQSSR